MRIEDQEPPPGTIKFPIPTVEAAAIAVCDCLEGYMDGFTGEARAQFAKLVCMFAREMLAPGSVADAAD